MSEKRYLTTRTLNCLSNTFGSRCEDVSADSVELAKLVAEMSESALLRIENFGKVSAAETAVWLQSFGLSSSTKSEQARKAATEARERAELARLKAKYEPDRHVEVDITFLPDGRTRDNLTGKIT